MKILSLIVPVFNEETQLVRVIERIRASLPDDCELIFVNDGSTDSSEFLIDQHAPHCAIVLHLATNSGKTTAVRNGLEIASGKYVIVQEKPNGSGPILFGPRIAR